MEYPQTSYNNNTTNANCRGCYWYDNYTPKAKCRNRYSCVNNEKHKQVDY